MAYTRQTFGIETPAVPPQAAGPNASALTNQLIPDPNDPRMRRPGETREDILLRTGSPIPGTPGVPGNATPSMSAQTAGRGVPSPGLSGRGDDLPGPPPFPERGAPGSNAEGLHPLANYIRSAQSGGGGAGAFGLEGYDADKLASGHDSPKYQIGRTISQFDPSKGITPEVIAALNELGLGTFEALDGDKVRVTGNVDPRFEGATTIDLIRAFSGPGADPNWQYGAIGPNEAGGGAPAGGGGAPMAGGGAAPAFGTPGIDPLLSGDPLRRIQEAIQAINGQGQVNMNALLGQLQPGA